jgi:hypothetical protein
MNRQPIFLAAHFLGSLCASATQRKGANVQSWEWQTVAGADRQLQLLQLKAAP